MSNTELQLVLKDSSGAEDISLSIFLRDYGIAIKPKGYSCKDGGEPLMVYNKGGKIQMLVWPDINKNKFDVHEIEGARDGKRKEGCDIAGINSGSTGATFSDCQAESDGV